MSLPTLNPLAALVDRLESVAEPLVRGAVPMVVVPILKVTVPLMLPAAVEDTDTFSVTGALMITLVGVAVNVVVVVGSAARAIVVLPPEAAKVVSPL